jgi:hypothetical protein
MNNTYFVPSPFPYKLKSFIYLLQIPILALLLKCNNEKNIILHNSILWAFLILFGLTIGWQNISPYLNKYNKSLTSTLYLGLELCLYEILLAGITIFLMGTPDPQGIKDIGFSLQHFFTHEMLQTILIAVSEELFKVLIFIGFLSFFRNKNLLTIYTAILIASFVFGGMHGFNYKLTSMLPIAISAIPSFIYLMKYNSIYPLIFCHFIFDIAFSISHIQPYGRVVLQLTLMLIGLGILIRYSLLPFILRSFLKFKYSKVTISK